MAVTPAPSGVSKESSDKVSMVVATLDDILQSIVNEEATETAIFQHYASWCKSEQDHFGKDISDARNALGNSKVLAEEQQSSIDDLKLFIVKYRVDCTLFGCLVFVPGVRFSVPIARCSVFGFGDSEQLNAYSCIWCALPGTCTRYQVTLPDIWY